MAVDELMKSSETQEKALIEAHNEEVADLRKQILALVSECEEKNLLLQSEKNVYVSLFTSLFLII